MNDWRGEPPDSPGVWDWLHDGEIMRLRIVRTHRQKHQLYVRRNHGRATTLQPIGEGGQWLKVPE